MTSTNSRVVLDSHAWVEYFIGGKLGEKVEQKIEVDICFTPLIVIAELSDKYSKDIGTFKELGLPFIVKNSRIVEINIDNAIDSGKAKNEIRKKFKNNFGLADAIILITAKKLGAKVLTGDHHFKPLKE